MKKKILGLLVCLMLVPLAVGLSACGNKKTPEIEKLPDTPTALTATMITVANATYTGSALTPDVTVKIGNVTIENTNYTLSWANNTNAGNGTVTVTAAADNAVLSGSAEKTFEIAKATPTISAQPTYTGATTVGTALTGLTAGTASTAGIFAFVVNQTIVLGASNYNYTFTPTDTTNYNSVNDTISITGTEAPAVDCVGTWLKADGKQRFILNSDGTAANESLWQGNWDADNFAIYTWTYSYPTLTINRGDMPMTVTVTDGTFTYVGAVFTKQQ
jgi:hypothetical protein